MFQSNSILWVNDVLNLVTYQNKKADFTSRENGWELRLDKGQQYVESGLTFRGLHFQPPAHMFDQTGGDV